MLKKLVEPLIKPEGGFGDFIENPTQYYSESLYLRSINPNTPMFLREIHSKCNKQKYKSSAELLDDVALIRANCVKFGAANPGLMAGKLDYLLKGTDGLMARVRAPTAVTQCPHVPLLCALC